MFKNSISVLFGALFQPFQRKLLVQKQGSAFLEAVALSKKSISQDMKLKIHQVSRATEPYIT